MALAAVLFAGCDQVCTTELRVAIGGAITDASGDPLVPTAVTTTVRGVTRDCEIFDNAYSCYERGSGDYALHIEAGGGTYDETFELDDDGCHVSSIEHDVVMP